MMNIGGNNSIEEKKLRDNKGKLGALSNEGLGYSGIVGCRYIDTVEALVKKFDWERPCELVMEQLRTYGVKKIFNYGVKKELAL